ncbi:MAG: glycosyltransferase [Bacteroidales bacterium]|nr:glycosyltransferase [Bacteroidales bacterium]
MVTKIVYILISTERDTYLEQLWYSLYSLRLHNKEANVVLLTDKATEETLVGLRAGIKEYLTAIQVVDVPESYTPKERSRFIKTTFRKHIDGPILFLDTDTIIAEDLSTVDLIESDVACVLDYHAQLDRLIEGKVIRKRMNDIFGLNVQHENSYFNSGVMLVKDTPIAHRLFDEWHKNWKIAAFDKGQCYDQPALMASDLACGHVIKELPGIWNCQVLTSIQYLHRAKVIHFFNNTWEGKSEWSPFFDDEIYLQLKRSGKISAQIKEYLSDPKSAFSSPTYFTSKARNEFMLTLVGATLYSGYKQNGFFYRMVNMLCVCRYAIIRMLRHGKI